MTRRLLTIQALAKDLERELYRGVGSGAILVLSGLQREIDAALRAQKRRA